jgi:hypothetical protein
MKKINKVAVGVIGSLAFLSTGTPGTNAAVSNTQRYTITNQNTQIQDYKDPAVDIGRGIVQVTSKPTSVPTSKPTSKPTSEPTSKPSPKPTYEYTTKPTPTYSAKPSPTPTPKVTAKPTPKVTPKSTPNPKPTPKSGGSFFTLPEDIITSLRNTIMSFFGK